MKALAKLGIFITLVSLILFLLFLFPKVRETKDIALAQDPEECRKPTSYTDPDGDATNPSNAYDGDCGDESTYADELIDQNPGDEIIFHTWQTTSYTYTSLTLYVKYTTSGFSDDLWCIYYSTDGGSSWNELVACNSNNYASIQTASVSLSASQDLSQLQVKVYGDKTKGPDNGHVHIYDVYTLGTYVPDTTPPTYSNDGDNSTGSVVEGGTVKVYALWEDNIGLSKGVLRTNKTGTWQNETWYDFTSNPEWFNATIDTTGYGGKTICWVQWANDTSNNWNTSMEMHCFQVSAIPVERWLEVEWDVSSDINSSQCTESSPCEVLQYNLFTASAKVTCRTSPAGYSCGDVYGSVRYNSSGTEPNELISTTPGSTPFYITDVFSYRRPITIDNTQNSNTLTDYQLAINITYDSDMQPDFSDLRFSWINETSGEEVEIPYWIEDYRKSSWVYVWVKVPEIPGSGTTTVYMYYGNVTPVSSESSLLLTIKNLNSTLESGTGGSYGNNVPIFQKPENNNTYYLGYSGSSPVSYYWSGSSWVNDNSFVNGLSSHYASHFIFLVPYELFNQFGIFESRWSTYYYNYYKYWDGSSWVEDTSKLPGNLPPCTDYSGGGYNGYIFVKNKTGDIILIRITNCGGYSFYEKQFWWDGSSWVEGNYVKRFNDSATSLGDDPDRGSYKNWYYWLGDYSGPLIYHFSYNLVCFENRVDNYITCYQYDAENDDWKKWKVRYQEFEILGSFNLLNESGSKYRLILSGASGSSVYFYETNFYRSFPEPTYSIGSEESYSNNPKSCNSLSDSQSCILKWTINATGLGDWALDVNFSAPDYNLENDTDSAIVRVSVIERWLEVEWDVSSDINSSQCTESSPCNINQYSRFNASVKVVCHTDPPGYSCGEVYGSIRYNKSTGVTEVKMLPTYAINSTENDVTDKVNKSDDTYLKEQCTATGFGSCTLPSAYINFTTSKTYENVVVEGYWDYTEDNAGNGKIQCWNGSDWINITSLPASEGISVADISDCDNSDGNYTFKTWGFCRETQGQTEITCRLWIDYIYLNASPTTTYDFKGITSPSYTHNATEFSYATKNVPLWHGNELSTTCYNAISNSDDSWCSHSPDLNNLHQFFQFHFKINENPSEITRIDYYWEGYADAAPSELYIYNFSSNSWERLGFGTSSATDNIISGSLTSDLQNYVSESYIHLMAITGLPTDQGDYLHTDYVYINVSVGGAEEKELISENPEQTEQPFNLPSYIVFFEGFDDKTKFDQDWYNYTNQGNDGSANNELTTRYIDKNYHILKQTVTCDSDEGADPEPFASILTKKGFDLNKTYKINIWMIGSGRDTTTGNELDAVRIMLCPTPTDMITGHDGYCVNGINVITWGYASESDSCSRDGCYLTGQFYILINQSSKNASVFFADGTPLETAQNIDISTLTQNYTFLINTYINTFTTGCTGSFIFNEVNSTSIEYFQPNPSNCGVLNDGEYCILNYTVKAIGNPGSVFKIDMNFTSNETISNETSPAIINITEPVVGTLEASIESPDPSTCTESSPCSVSQGDTFWINSTTTCSGGLCFEVNATPRYNSSSNEPDTSIGKDKSDTPFSILLPYGKAEYLNSTNLSFGDETVGAIAVDGEGNITIVGYDNTTGNIAWRIEKRKPDGTLLWSKVLDFSAGVDAAYGVTVDSQDNIIACGYDNVPGNEEWRVIKLDKNGNWLWNYTWNPSSGDDEASVCDVDSNDNILVGGWSVAAAGNDQWAVKKLDSNGNEIDSWTYNPTSGSDRLFSLVVDKSDNSVYVGGDHFVSGNDWNFAIRKLDSNLDLVKEWVQDFTPSWDESCFGLDLDSEGNVIGVGGTGGCPSHNCNWAFRIVKLNSSLEEIWNKSFDYSSWWDRAHCVAVNSRDEIFVAGIDEYIGYGQNQWRIIHLDSDGNKIAEFTLNKNNTDWLLGCALDKNEDLWVGGYLNIDDARWTIEKISRFDMQPCGYLEDGDICRVRWLVNVTGTSGVWAVDVFYNSSNSYVQSNDTDNVYIEITAVIYDASFAIALPSVYTWTQITSTTEAEANFTQPDWISFNFTDFPQSWVEPYAGGDSANAQQGAARPIFLIDNTGTGTIDIYLRFSSLPNGVTVYANCTCTGTCGSCVSTPTQISTSYVLLVQDLAIDNAYANITLYGSVGEGAQAGELGGYTIYIKSQT